VARAADGRSASGRPPNRLQLEARVLPAFIGGVLAFEKVPEPGLRKPHGAGAGHRHRYGRRSDRCEGHHKQLTVATRETEPLVMLGVSVIDPWIAI